MATRGRSPKTVEKEKDGRVKREEKGEVEVTPEENARKRGGRLLCLGALGGALNSSSSQEKKKEKKDHSGKKGLPKKKK